MKFKAKDPRFHMDNITIWGGPEELLPSQWGTIRYGDWCRKEAARIRSNGGRAHVKELLDSVAIIKPRN